MLHNPDLAPSSLFAAREVASYTCVRARVARMVAQYLRNQAVATRTRAAEQRQSTRQWRVTPAVNDADQGCQDCGHAYDEHVLVSDGDPLLGGVILCPERGCACVATWSVPQSGWRHVSVPDESTLRELRDHVQCDDQVS
jgi:hypothetical protein